MDGGWGFRGGGDDDVPSFLDRWAVCAEENNQVVEGHIRGGDRDKTEKLLWDRVTGGTRGV